MDDTSERRLALAFAREWEPSQTMAFETVYHENLRLSLGVKTELLARCGCVWLYDAVTRFADVYPFRDQPAVYVLSTTILPAFQGRGLGRLLKAFFLGVVSQAGFILVLGHARDGQSVRLNTVFGAEIHTAHPDWFGSGETYSFYTLRLEQG